MKYKIKYQLRWLMILFLLSLVYFSSLILLKLPFFTIDFELKSLKSGIGEMLISLLPRFNVEFHAYNLQMVVSWFCGVIFGPRFGCITLCIYILLGLIGFPVFSGGGGLSYIKEPTFGYLISLPISVFLAGYLFEKNSKLLAVIIPVIVTHLCGIIYLVLFKRDWLSITWHLSFSMVSYDLIFILLLIPFMPVIVFFYREIFIQEVPVSGSVI